MFLFCSHGVKWSCANLKPALDPGLAGFTRRFPGRRPLSAKHTAQPDFVDIDFISSGIRNVNRPAGQRCRR